jgi:hypothetical protein
MSLKGVRTNQAHFNNPKSTFINRQSIRGARQFKNLTHLHQAWPFKDSGEGLQTWFDNVRLTAVSAVPVVADKTTSTVVASPTTVASDGVDTSTITVTLKDADSKLAADKTVTLASSRGGIDTIMPASGISSASGVVTFTVTSTTAGEAVFTATDTTDSVTVTPTATVTFTTIPAPIAWGPATDDTLNGDSTAFVESDILTNGQFVAAVCNGNAGTLNGVEFQGCTDYSGAGGLFTYGSSPITLQWSPESGGRNASWGGPGNAYGGSGYDNGTSSTLLLTGGGDGVNPGTITLNSLVTGNTYQVQIWAPSWNNTFTVSVGGVAVRLGYLTTGRVPQYIVGTLTANGDNQTISWSGIAPSAVSLRDLTAASGYADWAIANGVSGGENGDSNNDGVQNGIAYFMNASGRITNPSLNGSKTVTWTNGGNIPSSAYGTQFVVLTS